MTAYRMSGGNVYVAKDADMSVKHHLPPAIYQLNSDNMIGYFLSRHSDQFSLPKKLYGDTSTMSQRVINTFLDRSVSTGVLAVGKQGSGKSLLAKKVCNELVEKGIPTIIISSRHSGTEFNDFINSIEQECVLFFDEFEKVYNNSEGHQEHLLTLIDGVYQSKKLWLLTANNEFGINSHLYSRPGRVFYRLNYNGLSEAVVLDYCNERLNNQQHLNGIVALSKYYDEDFNFDMLQALVEELNRYPNDTIQTVTSLLNFKTRSDVKYVISKVVANGETIDLMDNSDYKNIFDRDISVYLNIPKQYWIPMAEGDDKDDQETYIHLVLDTSMITSYVSSSNTAYFTIQKQHGNHLITYEIEFSPAKPKPFFNIANML